MIAARLGCVALAALLLVPSDSLAQGRGNGRGNGRGHSNGNGPAFCRSGAGHPVHGWAWCRDKGWTRDNSWTRDNRLGRDDAFRDRVIDRRDDRDRDNRSRRRGRR